MKVEEGKNKEGSLFPEEFDQLGPKFSSSLELEAYNKKQHVYQEVFKSYDQLRVRSMSLNEAKSKVLRCSS